MKRVLAMNGGRQWPSALTGQFAQWGAELQFVDPVETDWSAQLNEAYAFALLVPMWSSNSFLSGEQLWWQYLRRRHPQCRFLLVGYQSCEAENYVDLLQLQDYQADWLDSRASVAETAPPPRMQGTALSEKLSRFFAGHGQDSVVAVLSRMRLIAQMAQREVVKMGTPYEETYLDLLEPANLPQKWSEWRNRWVNYYPLFRYTPFAASLAEIARQLDGLEGWMNSGGREAEPLVSGRVLSVLNNVREQLSQIEQDYVLQELSYPHR